MKILLVMAILGLLLATKLYAECSTVCTPNGCTVCCCSGGVCVCR